MKAPKRGTTPQDFIQPLKPPKISLSARQVEATATNKVAASLPSPRWDTHGVLDTPLQEAKTKL